MEGHIYSDNKKTKSLKGKSLFDFADTLSIRVPTSCRRNGECHECIVNVTQGEENLIPKDGSEEFADHYDIVMGVKMDVFNCYYDKLRDGKRIRDIGWCDGGVSPPLFDKKSYLKTSGSGTEKKT